MAGRARLTSAWQSEAMTGKHDMSVLSAGSRIPGWILLDTMHPIQADFGYYLARCSQYDASVNHTAQATRFADLAELS